MVICFSIIVKKSPGPIARLSPVAANKALY